MEGLGGHGGPRTVSGEPGGVVKKTPGTVNGGPRGWSMEGLAAVKGGPRGLSMEGLSGVIAPPPCGQAAHRLRRGTMEGALRPRSWWA